MGNPSSKNAGSFCQKVLSSLSPTFKVFACYSVAGNPVTPESTFDYKIIVVSGFWPDVPLPLHRISKAKELSFLECLLLRQGS